MITASAAVKLTNALVTTTEWTSRAGDIPRTTILTITLSKGEGRSISIWVSDDELRELAAFFQEWADQAEPKG